MNRLQWCLLFLCSVSLSCGRCPKGPGCSKCSRLRGWIYLECRGTDGSSAFEVKFKPYEYLYIDCNGLSDWSEFRLGTIPEIQLVKIMAFRSCPGLESGIIIRKLNITNVESLNFFSSINTEALNVSQNTLGDFKGIKYLNVENDNSVNVPSDLLHDFSNLILLRLVGSIIEKIPDNFLTMRNLRSVDLSENNIQEISANAFGKLENLIGLSIADNELVQIMPNTFNRLMNLRGINLKGNQLETLPDDIFVTLLNLEAVNISGNNFTLEFLSRSALQNMSSLRILELDGNKQNLTTLPSKFFTGMKNLEIVSMAGNGLVTLPKDLFFGSSDLKNLSMEHNSIEYLPQELFRDCIHLEIIKLSFNQITNLHDELFSKLSILKILELSNNRIVTISDKTFNGLFLLRVLDMEWNNLQTIENSLGLLSLHVAKYSHNNLTLQNYYQNGSPFRYCNDMQYLDLAYNRISHIFDDWIDFRNLKQVNLRGNKLERITQRELLFRSNDLEVDLRDNNIRGIPPSIFNNSEYELQMEYFGPKIFSIAIDGNPLECDCEIYDLLCFLEKKMNQFVHDSFQLKVKSLKCQGPNSLKNTLVRSLKSETFKCLLNESQSINTTCPEKCDCWLRPYNRAYIIDCSNKGFDQAPAQIEVPPELPVELNLTGNHLTSMPSMSQSGYENITVLSLAHNNIKEVLLQSLPTNLQKLELHNNKLSKIDNSILNYLSNSPNLVNLTLYENRWECNCDQRELLKFIQAMRTRIPSLNNVTCGDENKSFFRMTSEELCPNEMGWMIASCIGIAVFGIIVGSLVAIYYSYQQEIKIWLYARQWCLWWVTEDELDKDKIYDAFISYSHKDDDFVVNQLVVKLEEGPRPFKLCVHYRDWPVGEWIPTQVIRSVQDSKRTVVVLSSNFLGSEWGKMEFRAAHRQALSEGRARVIVIIYGDIPSVDHLDSELQAYLTMNTYVKWGDPLFWDKLRYALPHRQNQ